MARKGSSEEKKAVLIRLPLPVYRKLSAQASKDHRSKSAQARLYIETALEKAA